MSNVLKVSHQEAIHSLHQKGWSKRRIARELGIHRQTVSRYSEGGSKCTGISIPGSGEELDSKCTTISIPGSESVIGRELGASIAGRFGRKSWCEPFEAAIASKIEAGLSAQRIYQDLVEEKGFASSYQSVCRFVRRLKQRQPQRVWRMECEPGEEMQVDFGLGAPIEQDDGKTRRSWVFRVVLSYSRKGYSEAVMRQDTESFLRCLENALRHFGGAPLLLNIDNLKAAVLKADWFDPQINPKLADFGRHYRIHVMPCRPRMPQHKGKVERGVSYVRGNALKGRRFKSLAEQNLFLRQWEENVADTRIHGTTCKQVAARFEEERPHLQPLPPSLFPCYQEARRNVSRDSFVEVQRAFYEAPPEYIGRQVWVRWDSRCVRIFNDRMEQVQIHLRLEPGKFSRILGAAGLSAPVLSSCRWWIGRAALLGEACGQWAQASFDRRGPEALRSIMGLCNLVKKHASTAIEAACQKALKAGTRRLKDIQRLIGEPSEQGNFAFAQHHPLIRDLKTYSDFISEHHRPNHDQQHSQKICASPASLGTA
jgi:transposase